MKIDRFRLAHWLNARKLTPGHLTGLSGLDQAALQDLLTRDEAETTEVMLVRLADALKVQPGQLTPRAGRLPAAVVRTAADLAATRRAIDRAGIHFYNYYTMAAPEDRVAPVILDILCPSDVLPTLNNGHLEPAITINLGPGPIHGRWGTELRPETWQVLEANTGGPDAWIAGESYVEPSYCPHSYSLASEAPARIVSYTGMSNLTGLLDDANTWPPGAFSRLVETVDTPAPAAALLKALLARRGFTAETAASATGVPAEALAAFLAGTTDALGGKDLGTLGQVLGFDHRVLLPVERRHDAVGKTSCDVAASRDTIRRFGRYDVASTACAPHLPDLVGLFLRVDGPDEGYDLCDHGETHYLVTGGELTLRWRDHDGAAVATGLGPDATAWVAPFVEHSWSGTGSLIKLGSGEHTGYLDFAELTNTFAPAATLRRGHRDDVGWGYDPR